jgi:hypothetical protein
MAKVWELSQPWYGTRASPAYRGRTPEQVEAILRSVGLDSPFWRFSG